MVSRREARLERSIAAGRLGDGDRAWRDGGFRGLAGSPGSRLPAGERRSGAVSCVGRQEELLLIDNVLDRSAAGGLGIALIEGETGIGKTRLLQEGLSRARARGFTVLYGAADEMDRTRPLGMLMDALEPVLVSSDPDRARLARLIGGDGTLQPQRAAFVTDLRHQVVQGVIELLERLAAQRPVALGLDDLHWADQSTLLVVRALGRGPLSGRIALIGCLRSVPSPRELQSVVEEQMELGASRIRLGPLDEIAVAELAEAVVGAPPAAGLREQLRRAGGNSLFLVELLAAWMREGLVGITDGAADLDGCASIPADLRLTLLRRLDALSVGTAQTLRLAAVLGSSFDVIDLSLLAGRSAVQLMPELREALQAALLEESGRDRLAFRHELVRKAIYEDLAPGIRAALHREAGLALAAAGAPALKVAGQLALGAGVGDTQAVTWLRRAAREASSHAPSIALHLLRQAVELTPPTDPDRLADVVELMYSLMWAGRSDEALVVGEGTLESAALDSAAECELRLAMAWALLLASRPGEARAQVDAARGLPRPGSRGGLGLEVAEAFARLSVGDLEGAVRLAGADEAGADALACPSLSLRAAVARMRGRTEEALILADQAVERGSRGENADALRWPSWLALAAALIDLDRFAEAEAQLRVGEQRITDFGGVWSLPLYRVWLVRLRYLAGRWDEALHEIEAGLRVADEAGVQLGRRDLLAYRALIASHRNDLPTATAALASSDGQPGRPSGDLVLWARALLEEARGDLAAARETLSCGWPALVRTVPSSCVLIGPRFVRLLVGEGLRQEAHAVCIDVERAAATMATASARAAVQRCSGLLTGDPQPLIEAVAVLRGLERGPALAASAEDAGNALVRAGRVAEGRRLLQEAHRVYDGLRAVHDRARVGAALRRVGARSAARGARPARPVTGPESLTPAQRAVAQLVAEGLTNPAIARRLFVSTRTVETHVAHAFKKMNVRSRVELRRSMRAGLEASGVDGPRPDASGGTRLA
jgi:DNA-binding CsgD family transcriptional regulator